MPDQPHYFGHRRRLRERFERAGLDSFAPHEVLELLLTLAIPRKDVKVPAKELLARFGSLRGVLDAELSELREVGGLGGVAPVALRVIRETAELYLRERAASQPILLTPEVLADFWRSRLGRFDHEVFEVGYLDASYKLLSQGVETLQRGTVDRAVAYPRRVMQAALKRGAAALVLAHNHPSGVLIPSKQDRDLTRALVLAAAPLDLKVHDHLIVSRDDVFSFRSGGLL